MNWQWKKPDPSMITVWIKWASGAMKRTVPFWYSDAALIRDTREKLPWLSKNEQLTVDRP